MTVTAYGQGLQCEYIVPHTSVVKTPFLEIIHKPELQLRPGLASLFVLCLFYGFS